MSVLRQLDDAEPEGALLCATSSGGAQRGLDVLDGAVRVTTVSTTVSPGRAARYWSGGGRVAPSDGAEIPSKTGKRCPSIGQDEVAASRRRSGRARLAGHVRPMARCRRARPASRGRARRHGRRRGPFVTGSASEGDDREDEPGEQEVDGDARERMRRRVRSALVDEGARVDRFALLPFEPHEAADGQPVQRVDRLLAAVEDERARREADAELVDPHAGATRP